MADDTVTEQDAAAPVEADELREDIVGRLGEALGDALLAHEIVPGVDLTVRVRTDAWGLAAEVARHRLGARYFTFVSAIDWMPSPYGRSMNSEVDLIVARTQGTPEQAAVEAATSDEGGDDTADTGAIEGQDGIVQGVCGGDTRFQVFGRVAHVGEPGRYWGMTIKADVPDEPFAVDSWVPVYAGADWHERETWEMFGIEFVGHPGLRHIYLPSDFEGFPLRKEFPLLARMVKPWPGIVDVEQMPTLDEPEPAESVTGSEGTDPAQAASGDERVESTDTAPAPDRQDEPIAVADVPDAGTNAVDDRVAPAANEGDQPEGTTQGTAEGAPDASDASSTDTPASDGDAS
jgi:NADH-quinone oxidoreductase subunit C